MSRLGCLAAAAVLAATVSAEATATGTRYRGHLAGDRTETVRFTVSGGRVRGFEAVVYATCYSGGMLTTVTIPPTRITAGRFSAKYQPVKGSQTFVYVRGTITGARASGTIRETGACMFRKQSWAARRR